MWWPDRTSVCEHPCSIHVIRLHRFFPLRPKIILSNPIVYIIHVFNSSKRKPKQKHHTLTSTILQLGQQALALKQQDDLVNSRPDVRLGHIDDEVRILRVLIWVIDTSEALNLTSTCLGVYTAPVCLLGMLEGCGNVDEEE